MNEINLYLERVEDLRAQVANIVKDLPTEALNWRPIDNADGEDDYATNSLGVMATHVAGAEQHWIHEVIGRDPATRDRPAEFVAEVESAAELTAKFDKVAERSRQIIQSLTPENLDETRTRHDRTFTVRWCLMHVVDHTALHLGHMQITYQLWNSGRGVKSPRWFERFDNR